MTEMEKTQSGEPEVPAETASFPIDSIGLGDGIPGFKEAWESAKRSHERGEFAPLDISFIDRFIKPQE